MNLDLCLKSLGLTWCRIVNMKTSFYDVVRSRFLTQKNLVLQLCPVVFMLWLVSVYLHGNEMLCYRVLGTSFSWTMSWDWPSNRMSSERKWPHIDLYPLTFFHFDDFFLQMWSYDISTLYRYWCDGVLYDIFLCLNHM